MALSNTDNLCDFDDGPVGRRSLKNRPATFPSQRRCVVTREHEASELMLRFVMGPEGQLVPDFAARLPGRGGWVKTESAALDSVRLKQAFSKAFRKEVKIPAGIVNFVRKGLANRLQDGISLARRAGEAVCGFQKCRERLISGKVGILLCSSGASRDELDRLRSGCRSVPVGWVPEQVLASVFGRDQVVYAVIGQGALAQRLVADCKRFSGVMAETSLPYPDMGQ